MNDLLLFFPIKRHLKILKILFRNPYVGNAFGGGFPQGYAGPFPPQALGAFGAGAGFGSGLSPQPAGMPFQGGNIFGGGVSPFQAGVPFQGGNPFVGGAGAFPPSPFAPSGFSAPPMGGQFGQGFGYPPGAGGFGGYPPQNFGPQFPGGQPPQYGNPNYFGSGSYGRQRSRGSSRRRSGSRRRRSSSSSSSDDNLQPRGSPFVPGPPNPYANLQPYPNMPPLSPRGGSPIIPPPLPPHRPAW